jgi:hypothetical protein
MEPQHGMPASEAGSGTPAACIDRHDVALEPGQAWCLKGVLGEPDEIVIPGLLLDDLGNCSSVEARMPVPTFYQMLAMVARAEERMQAARAAPDPERARPEANVWHLEGILESGRLRIDAIGALDRVVVDAYGAHRMDSLRSSEILPGQRAWR